jgi:drug/metabolite transporter (DMT)-like permease
MGVSRRVFFAVGFLALCACDTAGQFGFKLAALSAGAATLDRQWILGVLASPWIYVAVGAYVGAFFVWMTLLAEAPVGPAFAASHLEIVSVLILSAFVLGESFSWRQAAGCCLVLAGIGVLASGAGPGDATAKSG